jgi:signal transduction histidine kinase
VPWCGFNGALATVAVGGRRQRHTLPRTRRAAGAGTNSVPLLVQGSITEKPVLVDFLTDNRKEISDLAHAKVLSRQAPSPTEDELSIGLPLFMDQLIHTLNREADRTVSAVPVGDMERNAGSHGLSRLARGFTVAQVVHDYGSICQAVTELAVQRDLTISAREFGTFNRCLDEAIANAVTEYGRQRDQNVSDREVERLGVLAHELRNLVGAAMLSYQALQAGTVAIGGSTGAVLGRSLRGLRDVIDRSLSDVRLAAGSGKHEPVLLAEVIEDVEVAATMDARARGLRFTVAPTDDWLVIAGDRQLLASALSNVLQNAFKFSRASGQVSLRTRVEGGRVLIEVEDECGGLPVGKAEELFRPFEKRGTDRSGLGLGLAISLGSVKANEGDISVRDLPGKGCIFTISLPVHVQPTLTH